MSLNKVMLIGNVGRDPNVRYLDGNAGGQGSKVATFTLATTERYRDRSGETRENTEWHNIVAWRNSADLAEKFIHKGTQIYVEGRLRTRSYTDQAGVQKYTTEVVADNIQLGNMGYRHFDISPNANFILVQAEDGIIQYALNTGNPGNNGLGGWTGKGNVTNKRISYSDNGDMHMQFHILSGKVNVDVFITLYHNSKRAVATIMGGREITMYGEILPYRDNKHR